MNALGESKLEPRAKKAWLAALRSGEITQGYSVLCEMRPDGTFAFCCLGVLCNLGKKRAWAPPGEHEWSEWLARNDEDDNLSFSYGPAGDAVFLPKDVQEKVGLSDADMHFLVAMNDSLEEFPEIADWIDKNL